jgi:DNA-binding NarL/FixJ family response regulator
MRSLAWRALLARSISGGEGGEGAALASQHLDWAQGWGLPAALGVAQRAAGLATEGEERIARLEAAAATLSASALRTEEARARSDLGVALLRAGRRRDGRRELEEAVGLALGCGARSTARRAAEELDIAGASPRALPFDELTPSERRVAEMAAAGRTNRQIAEQLYVSAKTVENHLTRVYAKLGVGSRRQLEGAL